jgi:2-polyprenyl-3-methyl-5-hydroxy-6-metoxy-1,4-benzoquinol methylase
MMWSIQSSLTAGESMNNRKDIRVDHYGAQYGHFSSDLYAGIRSETFGEDIGQNGWLTADEQDLFIRYLQLETGSKLLDVACGSGGPTLRMARLTGCSVHGVDAHEQAIAEARAHAEREGLTGRAIFDQLDANQALPIPDATFNGVVCIDAVNHLPNRQRVFADWARLLRPGGHLVFTDPTVVTGPLTNQEVAIRSSVGFFLFVPVGFDARLLEEAGFEGVDTIDRTENMARIADRWRSARDMRARELRKIEGDHTFEGQQRFFEIAARLAAERRLSRFAFHCVRR